MVNANSIDSTKARSGALSRASLMAAVMLFSMMPRICGLRGVGTSPHFVNLFS